MKRILILISALLLMAGLAFGQSTKAAIAGTPHDITLPSGRNGCAVCHAPHNSTSNLRTVLLWYPTGASGTFATYTATQINTTPTNLAIPAVATDATTGSFMCLSCHDGTTAATNFGVAGVLNGATFTGTLSDGVTAAGQPSLVDGTLVTNTGAVPADTDLTNDHPVNFTFPDPIPGGVVGFDTLANMKTAGFKFFGSTADSFQCATCHNPHDQNSAASGFYLRTSAATTVAFCTQCHL